MKLGVLFVDYDMFMLCSFFLNCGMRLVIFWVFGCINKKEKREKIEIN